VGREQPRVVIVGGGFGGLYAAKALRRAPVRVTLLDRNNHHLFQPLLYQVATAGLSPGDIAHPIRGILRRQRNAEVLLAEAAAVDVAGRRVILTDGEVPYDYLVLATGVTHHYFGHDEWARRAPGLKTLEDALAIRALFLTAFERAEREVDPGRRSALLTFVIVGGGPTGVELAGAMAEMAHRALARDFRRIDPRGARVILLEGSPRVLPSFPEDLSRSARDQLASLGVEVRTVALVTGIEPGRVRVGGEVLETENVFWAAGVVASPLGASLGAPLDRFGRVKVLPDLSVPDRPEVMVIGDLAALADASGRAVPGVCPAAVQMGRYAARRIRDLLAGRATPPFRYRDKGTLATIGRAAAVADFGRIRITGLAAWVAWLTIHIYFLIGFRNRLLVMIQWAWAYVRSERGARLITYQKPGR
jgi:NADH dehydrogenase